MEGIRQYILSVTAAGILCAVVRSLLPEKALTATIVKFVSGIFLVFVVISPIRNIEIGSLSIYIDTFSQEGKAIAASGEATSADALREIIKTRTEAYILDKAGSLGATLDVEVSLTDAAIPEPREVRLIGAVSPYARAALEDMLEEEFGISKENQTWIGQT